MMTDGARIAFDSNFVVYATEVIRTEADLAKADLAKRLSYAIPSGSRIIPAQVLGELFNVLTKRGGFTREDAQLAVGKWESASIGADTTSQLVIEATDLAARHRLAIWDAIILAAAAAADCDMLLSEDMQNGFRWRGVEVVNPFAVPLAPRLAALLAG